MAPSVSLSQDTLEALGTSLLNTSGLVPLHDRFRALFILKVAQEQEKEIVIIGDGVFVHFLFTMNFILVHRPSAASHIVMR